MSCSKAARSPSTMRATSARSSLAALSALRARLSAIAIGCTLAARRSRLAKSGSTSAPVALERYAVCLFDFVKRAEKTVIDDSLQTWQDLRQIVLTRSYEVRDWCKAFGCTKEELHDAVKAVGTSAQKVREYLKR